MRIFAFWAEFITNCAWLSPTLRIGQKGLAWVLTPGHGHHSLYRAQWGGLLEMDHVRATGR